MSAVLNSRSELNALINLLQCIMYRDSNIPLMEPLIYVHFVWYQHCDDVYFIQYTSLLFT